MIMTQLFARAVVLVNETNCVIQLKESRRSAPDGFYSYTIQLDPSNHTKKIGATMFHRRAKQAGRPTVIRIFADGVECLNKVLTPQVFIDFFRISFRIGEDGEVTIRGVRARGIDQLRRIRGLRFLIGNDRQGGQGGQEGQEEDIA